MVRLLLAPIPLLLVSIAVSSLAAGPEQPFRTQVPEVTASRWTGKLPPAPRPGKVTRADYMEFIRHTYERARPSAISTAGSPDTPHQMEFARREAFFYKATGDESRARLALKFIQGDYAYYTKGKGVKQKTHFGMCAPAIQAYWWIRSSPSLAEKDHELCRRWLRMIAEDKHANFEYGAMNRSTGSALGRFAMTLLYPDDPKNAERRRYSDTVWNDWWKFRDTDENSNGYNSLWWYFITTWIEVAEKEDLYQDPQMKEFVYRFLAQASPLGVMPHFGDGCGWNNNPGRWIALFERWASVYKDGRFKWVAHRLFEYTVPHEEEMWQWGNINYSTIDALMDAWLAADDSIEETEPDLGSVVTHRKAMRFMTREERQKTGYYAQLTDRVIPNKLMLRTGWQPDDTYAMVELCPPMGHGQSDAGSINCFLSEGSLLLGDTPYLVKDQQFHNCFVVKPYAPPEGGWRWRAEELARMRISLEDFHASKEAAYARVHIERYMDQPVTLDRRIFFLGEVGIWVRDSVEATEPYSARIGPAWQTTAVYGKKGSNWVNTCMVSIPVAYIWELKYMMQWKNRPRDLLLYFVPQPGAEVVIDDVTHDETRSIVDKPLMNNFTRRVWHQKTAALQPQKPLHFSTVLLPHRPTPDATRLAEGIESVLETGKTAVLKLAQGPGRELWAGINDSGESLRAGKLETDAKWFMLRTGPEGVRGYWLIEATYLKVAGRQVFSSAQRRTVDRLSQQP